MHPALFYRGDDEYLSALVPFLAEGLEQGGPVAVAVPGRKLELLRAALGGAADSVFMLDMSEAGRNPGRIIPGVLRAFADKHRDTHVRIIGEPIWPGRSRTEYPACAQHEALINEAFTGRDVTILCPYDKDGLDEVALADARATHPVLWESGAEAVSEAYAPDVVVSRYNEPLNSPADAARFLVDKVTLLPAMRRFVGAGAVRHGLSRDRAADLALIATELVTNSLLHTPSARAELRLWRDGDHVTCQVRDDGHVSDPMAGRLPRTSSQPGGRGLLMVNHLADLVRIHTTPSGTTVQALCRI
ncbi:anti-sigma regulatory factor [Amycolatopsis acidiphila]|nr:anti-sigma regulatory factor [Amycolatopsis acidiphila]